MLLTQERTEGNKFLSHQRYKYNNKEYRRKEIEIVERDGEIIALNPVADIHFIKEGDMYVGRNFKKVWVNEGYLRSEAILEKDKAQWWTEDTMKRENRHGAVVTAICL